MISRLKRFFVGLAVVVSSEIISVLFVQIFLYKIFGISGDYYGTHYGVLIQLVDGMIAVFAYIVLMRWFGDENLKKRTLFVFCGIYALQIAILVGMVVHANRVLSIEDVSSIFGMIPWMILAFVEMQKPITGKPTELSVAHDPGMQHDHLDQIESDRITMARELIGRDNRSEQRLVNEFFGNIVGIILFIICILTYFPGGTIFMSIRCHSRDLSGWDWVLSVIVPLYGVIKGIFGC